MRSLLAPLLLAALTVGCAQAQPATPPAADGSTMTVTPLSERPPQVGPADVFTGTTLIGPLFDPEGARGFGGAWVTFLPGARTNWHSHPGGQTLVVTEGVGWVQSRGGERREVRAGDVVWTPPGVEHWHGGTAEQSMTHMALQEAEGGQVVVWLEAVSDAEYTGPSE